MQHTFHLKATNLNRGFVDTVKKLFGSKEIKVIIEDETSPDPPGQELYQATLALIERFKDARIDPNLDLSGIASEVNL
jgi:hypothetical protein